MRREDTYKFGEFNRPRDLSALEAIALVEILLDAMPNLDFTARDYEQLINAYARRLREHTSQLEHQLLRDWGRA